MRIESGVTTRYVYFVAVDSTDFATRETGLSSFTVYRSRNGAAAAAMTTPTINETDTTNMPGVYELLLDEDMTIGSGNDTEEMVFHITATGMAPVTRTIELYRSKITAGNTLGVAADGDISGNLDGSVVGSVSGNVVGSVASVTGAVGSVTGAVGSVTASVTIDAASVDAIWDETMTAHVTADSAAVAVKDILVDTADMQPKIGAPAADVSADIAAVKAETALIVADTNELQTDNVPGLIAALNDVSTAQVNAEVVDALNTDTYAEPGQGAPAATATLAAKINYLYKAWRNKSTQDATTYSLYDDAGTTVDQKATVSDDATTATKGEVVTGP